MAGSQRKELSNQLFYSSCLFLEFFHIRADAVASESPVTLIGNVQYSQFVLYKNKFLLYFVYVAHSEKNTFTIREKQKAIQVSGILNAAVMCAEGVY